MMKFNFLNDFKDTMSLGLNRCGSGVKRHMPELLFVGGAGLIYLGVFKAGEAGVKWEEKKDEHEIELDKLQELFDDGEISEDELAKENLKEYGRTTIDFSKCWAKSLIITTVGLSAVGYGFKLLHDENRQLKDGLFDIALATAAYRGRVRDYVGEDKEYDLFHNIKRELVEEEYVDENGKKKKRKVEKIVNEGEQVRGGHNSYFFGCGDAHYNDMLSNKFFIDDSEKMFNRMLVGRGDHGVLKKAEVLRHFRWDDHDPYPLEAEENGWIYLKEEDYEGHYEYYDDGTPRIVKFNTSKDFGIDTSETWVDLNCYPVAPFLKAYQEELLKDRFGKQGKYIAAN